jgi:8-oxo-dGTP pyrophosphatase MutT (NUDIX family)
MSIIHCKPIGVKTGIKVANVWLWERADWKLCSVCDLYHSNRKIPQEYWNKTWNKPKRERSGIILVRGKKDILVTQSYDNRFGFPKGGDNEGEFPPIAAMRELKEETGIDIEKEFPDLDLLECEQIRYRFDLNYYTFYVVEVPEEFEITTIPNDDIEISAFGWVPIYQISSMKFSTVMKFIFNDYMKKCNPRMRTRFKIKKRNPMRTRFKIKTQSNEN